MIMNVTVIGTGYVGLTTAIALAYLGHEVSCVDKNAALVSALSEGRIPLHEPGIPELFPQIRHRLNFTTKLDPRRANADVILICVGTPSQENGDADLTYVEEAATAISANLAPGARVVIANKSTVPVGSAQRVESIIRQGLEQRGLRVEFSVASNPEFLREGAALHDTFYPDRILVGSADEFAVARLRSLYSPILEQTFAAPPGLPRPEGQTLPVFLTMTATSAELSKYAANAFLAMKISFANEIGGIAERVGADIKEVMRAVGLDRRIGLRYLGAGAGWGGSCFGKDLQALIFLASQYGYEMPLVKATIQVNRRQRRVIVEKLQQALKVVRGRTVALWGVTFKPNTDDLRDAPARDVARHLLDIGATVRAFDPVGMERAHREWQDLPIEYTNSPFDAARGADAVILMTEWDVFTHVDWSRVAKVMREPVIIDGRNVLDDALLRRHGFKYWGVGR